MPAASVELSLERSVHGGMCLARLPGGRIALVTGGLPGEVVRAELSEHKGVVFGAVTEVEQPSAGRVPSPAHPGLDLGHAAYPLQLEIKREVVRDAAARALRRAVAVPEVLASERVWGYRSAVQPALSDTGLGYRRPNSHEVVALDEDPVATAGVRQAWDAFVALHAARPGGAGAAPFAGVREVVIRANGAGESLVTLVATSSAKSLLPAGRALVEAGITGVAHAGFDPRGRFRSGFERLAGKRSIRQRYGGFELTLAHGSFAQPNVLAAARLFADLADLAGDGLHAVDLFAGGGPIAMHLARRFERVTAFELDRSSITHGAADALRHGLDNVAFVRGDAKRQPLPADADLVVVDPPRAGLAKEVRSALHGSPARRLIYVSCEVSTWARDVADLEERGFGLVSVQPFDFYPHTHHVELLSLLER